jgi:hypothetical protein
LGEVALRIRRAVDAIDRDSVQRHLACLDGLRKMEGIDVFQNVACPGLLISNLSQLPIKSIDFGSGPPLDVYPVMAFPRLALIMKAKDGFEVRSNLSSR